MPVKSCLNLANMTAPLGILEIEVKECIDCQWDGDIWACTAASTTQRPYDHQWFNHCQCKCFFYGVFYVCSSSTEKRGASNAKVMGSIPREIM